jgi:hypothetical protein
MGVTLKIRHSPTTAVIVVVMFAVVAAFWLVAAVLSLGDEHAEPWYSFAAAFGAVLLAAGFGLAILRGWFPLCTITETHIAGARRRWRIGPGDQLAIIGDKLALVRADGQREHLPIGRWRAHPDDWQDLATSLAERDQLDCTIQPIHGRSVNE